MTLNPKKTKWLVSILTAAVISICIGTVFLMIGSQTWKISFSKFIWNTGYSLNLGMALFANGVIFEIVEKKCISWTRFPVRSVFIALATHIIYSSFVIIVINWLWFVLFAKQTWGQFMTYGWFIFLGEYIILFLITAIIYARSFFKEWREEVIEGEKLKQEAIALQYQVMQNQVNPHFLFNSLNALGSLIDIDVILAKEFTRELSMFYRELLYFKDKELVPLIEELSFVRKYIYLQKIRFGENFDVQIHLKNENDFEVIPMSIQMMIENAVKHNVISKEKPLNIIIGQTDDSELFIENNLQLKDNVSGCNQIGLKNLIDRYKFLTDKQMIISQSEHFFRVNIPLINLKL